MRHSKRGCCEESKCGSGLRNNYFVGKRLTADSFDVEQRYGNDRRQLLNRAIHGWGVVYGLGIAASLPAGLEVTGGLALDKCGRELLMQSKTLLEIDDDLIVLDEKFKNIDPKELPALFSKTDPKEHWLLRVHYAEQPVGRVSIPDSCQCDHEEWDRICETVRFSLQKESISGEKCCDSFDCELECKCGHCCDESKEDDPRVDPSRPQYQGHEEPRGDPYGSRYQSHSEPGHGSQQHEPDPGSTYGDTTDKKKDKKTPRKRGGCGCLCNYVTGLNFPDECGRLCPIDEGCGTVKVDLRNGVPLACVSIVGKECDWRFGDEIEACGPRRLVKRNDLLFDLIRGCDVTGIDEIGWEPWHRGEVTYQEFSAGFGPVGYEKPEYVTEKFSVTFTRAVRKETLRPDCFSMTVLFREPEGAWQKVYRVPITDLLYIAAKPDDPKDHVRGAKLVVAGDWVEDALRGRARIFRNGTTYVEIEVRGDFIVDCNGQTVDANAIGISRTSFGNGTPGGTFLSTFRVTRKRSESAHDRAEWSEGESS